ncbi:MAG TPA: PAS domain-containing protein, partial [Puia sp.]|nr:PAS domain-containing protein [Puia sp.]
MKSPFRKLIRISVVLFVLVLLLNFFGYYINHIRSLENKELIEAINRSSHQQTLSQRIAKQTILMLDHPEQVRQDASTDTLARLIDIFEANQNMLVQQVNATPTPVPQKVFQIKLLLSTAQPYFETITAISREVSQADSAMLVINKKMYLRDLLAGESRYNGMMSEVNTHYSEMVQEKSSEVATIDTTKLVSLIAAIIGLIILVLEPAFKKGERNYKELQKARNDLLNEKKFLASILQSQTNYVIRINRSGHFTYANPAFLKTFGYTEQEVQNILFYTTIFPKDLARCQQVAEQCWNNPGKVFRLVIRKPIGHTRQFLWTEWEFLALADENGRIEEIQGIGSDISEKLQMEQGKEEAIRTLSYAMTYAKMGSWKLDLISGELALSKEFKALLAMDAED